MSNGDAKPKDQTTDDEEGDVEADADERNTADHDTTADHNTGAATQDIGSVGYEGNGNQGADGHGRSDETKGRAARVAECCMLSSCQHSVQGHGLMEGRAG